MQDQNIPMKACCQVSYASSTHIYIHIMITCLLSHLRYWHPVWWSYRTDRGVWHFCLNLFVATVNEAVNKRNGGSLNGKGVMCLVRKYFSIFIPVTGRRYFHVFHSIR